MSLACPTNEGSWVCQAWNQTASKSKENVIVTYNLCPQKQPPSVKGDGWKMRNEGLDFHSSHQIRQRTIDRVNHVVDGVYSVAYQIRNNLPCDSKSSVNVEWRDCSDKNAKWGSALLTSSWDFHWVSRFCFLFLPGAVSCLARAPVSYLQAVTQSH